MCIFGARCWEHCPVRTHPACNTRQYCLYIIYHTTNLWCLPALQNTRNNNGQVYNTTNIVKYITYTSPAWSRIFFDPKLLLPTSL